MILADKIINERKKLGWSQEELADQLDVSRQSVSKWESAQSTPDLNKILKMADLFGVSTDYLLKDEIEVVDTSEYKEDVASYKEDTRKVSLEEATRFLEVVKRTAPKVAFGVSLCIASPALLMFLLGFSEMGYIGENLAVAIGIVVLLVMVASAVFMFIMINQERKPFEFLETVKIDTAYGVDGMAKERKAEFESRRTMMVGFGVMCCILCSVPLIISALFSEKFGNESLVVFMVGVLLILVSTGVNLIINGSEYSTACDKLLQSGDYTLEGKKASKKIGKIGSIYWPVVVAAYLGASFVTGMWEYTWIIWPVMAVLFGAVAGIVKASMKE